MGPEKVLKLFFLIICNNIILLNVNVKSSLVNLEEFHRCLFKDGVMNEVYGTIQYYSFLGTSRETDNSEYNNNDLKKGYRSDFFLSRLRVHT